jgi:hypothetical protein
MAFLHPLRAPTLAAVARCGLAVLGVLLVASATAQGQSEPSPLRLEGVKPGGVRMSATESWGAFDLSLLNRSDSERTAQGYVFYDGHPDLQYGRELWVPPRSTLNSWMLVGPAPQQERTTIREVQNLLYVRSDKDLNLVLPEGESRLRARGILYRKREPTTVIYLDEAFEETPVLPLLPPDPSFDEESIELVRCFRSVPRLSEMVFQQSQGPLPPLAEAFEGIDHFVVASERLGRDLAGMRAVRHWLEQGGKVWVMLDRVDPDKLGPLLGSALDFQLSERVSLNRFRIESSSGGRWVEAPEQMHERAVAFARIVLPPHEHVRDRIGAWPLWFSRQVGRGTVFFTTLGPRGWHRPRRRPPDPVSPYPFYARLPVPSPHLEVLADEFQPNTTQAPFDVTKFEKMLVEDIGYSVPGRTTVGLILGGFLVGTLVLGVVLRWSGRAEWLGWLVPLAATAAAALFLMLGWRSRQSVPPTLAVAQIVDPVPHQKEAAVRGLLALYHPDSGEVSAGVEQGGFFQLDLAGSEGETRRLLLTDMDAWHWDNVSMPAGVRLAPFRGSVSLPEPVVATAHFGSEGLEGKLVGPCTDAGDALITNPDGRPLAVHLQPDGRFRVTPLDILPRDQLVAGSVLSDRQQRRQEIYRTFLQHGRAEHLHQRPFLLVWGKPLDMHFQFRLGAQSRTIGDALFVVPLSLERSPQRQQVTIPAPFLSFRRILDNGVSTRPKTDSPDPADMRLRFQLPPEILPFNVERARLSLRIEAAARRVRIGGWDGDRPVELRQVVSPLDPIHVDVTQPRLLQLDAEGGLYLNLNVGDTLAGDAASGSPGSDKWIIEYLELEVMGRCLAGP